MIVDCQKQNVQLYDTVLVECQKQDIFGIKNGIPEHGLQRVLFRYNFYFGQPRVRLACGCTMPVAWLRKKDQDSLKQSFMLWLEKGYYPCISWSKVYTRRIIRRER